MHTWNDVHILLRKYSFAFDIFIDFSNDVAMIFKDSWHQFNVSDGNMWRLHVYYLKILVSLLSEDHSFPEKNKNHFTLFVMKTPFCWTQLHSFFVYQGYVVKSIILIMFKRNRGKWVVVIYSSLPFSSSTPKWFPLGADLII